MAILYELPRGLFAACWNMISGEIFQRQKREFHFG